jgi:hypothetical protein
MATWRQALEVGMTDEEVVRLMAVSRSRTDGEPGAACADASGLSRESIFFCRRKTDGSSSSDGPTLHRTGAGLWAVDGAR